MTDPGHTRKRVKALSGPATRRIVMIPFFCDWIFQLTAKKGFRMLNVFKDWIISLIVNFILEQIRNGGVKQMAERLENVVQPIVMKWKQEVIERLKADAAATKDTKLDDTIVQAVDVFLEALITSSSRAVVTK